MPKHNPFYHTQEFYDRWHSRETLESIAASISVSYVAIHQAAMRKGWPCKWVARGS